MMHAIQTEGASLSAYYKKINAFPLMSLTEEKKVAQLASRGDKQAKEKMVVSNLRFVVKVASKYAGKGVPLVDLVSEGNIGLMRAVETYDASRGFHFISYAVHWIKQSIIKSIAEKSKLVRMPLSWNNSIYRIARIKAEKGASADVEDRQELMRETGLSEKGLIALQEFMQSPVSLDDEFVSGGMGGMQLKSVIINKNSVNPEQKVILDMVHEELRIAIGKLKPMEQEILQARFGFAGSRKTLIELGKNFNLTKERIRQIEKRAIEKLKTMMGSKDGIELFD